MRPDISLGGRNTLSTRSSLRTKPKPARLALTMPVRVRTGPAEPRRGAVRPRPPNWGERGGRLPPWPAGGRWDLLDERDFFRKPSNFGWGRRKSAERMSSLSQAGTPLVDFRGGRCVHFAAHRAQVAELVDALVSGTSG